MNRLSMVIPGKQVATICCLGLFVSIAHAAITPVSKPSRSASADTVTASAQNNHSPSKEASAIHAPYTAGSGHMPKGDSAAGAARDTAVKKTAAPLGPAKPGMARVMIVSAPSGAQVYIDDSLAGATPFETNTLSAGTHTLSLKAEGYEDFHKVDEFASQSRRKIIIHLTSLYASLSVRSTPPGAGVILNGTLVGVTPLDTSKLDRKSVV